MSSRKNKVASGTIATFGGVAFIGLDGVEFDGGGQPVNMTNLSDEEAVYEDGQPDRKATVTCNNSAQFSRGSKGDLIITYPDATTEEIYNAMISNVAGPGASKNAPLKTVYTIVHSTATGST